MARVKFYHTGKKPLPPALAAAEDERVASIEAAKAAENAPSASTSNPVAGVAKGGSGSGGDSRKRDLSSPVGTFPPKRTRDSLIVGEPVYILSETGELLSEQQTAKVRQHVIGEARKEASRLTRNDETLFRPTMEKVWEEGGTVRVTCGDQKTLAWLLRKIHQIALWDGCKLKIVSLAGVPKKPFIQGTIPTPYPQKEQILKQIADQNRDLLATQWTLQRYSGGGKGLFVRFGVTADSMAKLKNTIDHKTDEEKAKGFVVYEGGRQCFFKEHKTA